MSKAGKILEAITPTKVPVKGFLFGHYDSRGGTAFVVADDRREAMRQYTDNFWPGESPSFGRQDLIGAATLYVDKVSRLVNGVDLEAGTGKVFAAGKEDEEFPRPIPDLEYVPRGQKPVVLTGDYHHPEWSDDAYSFLIVKDVPKVPQDKNSPGRFASKYPFLGTALESHINAVKKIVQGGIASITLDQNEPSGHWIYSGKPKGVQLQRVAIMATLKNGKKQGFHDDIPKNSKEHKIYVDAADPSKIPALEAHLKKILSLMIKNKGRMFGTYGE